MHKTTGVKKVSTTVTWQALILAKCASIFWNCSSSNVMKILFSYLKIPIIKERVHIWLKVINFTVFYGCPCFLNMVMDNVYDKQLKSKGPENWKKLVEFN